jgi:hypothetical protein
MPINDDFNVLVTPGEGRVVFCDKVAERMKGAVGPAVKNLAILSNVELDPTDSLVEQVKVLSPERVARRLHGGLSAKDLKAREELYRTRFEIVIKDLEAVEVDKASFSDHLAWFASLSGTLYDTGDRVPLADWVCMIDNVLKTPCKPCFKVGREGCKVSSTLRGPNRGLSFLVCRFCHDDKHWRIVPRDHPGRRGTPKVYGRVKTDADVPAADEQPRGPSLCLICVEREEASTLQCGHCNFCSTCVTKLTDCPLCREPVKFIVHQYK